MKISVNISMRLLILSLRFEGGEDDLFFIIIIL